MNTKHVSNITYSIMEKIWDFNTQENMPRRSFSVDFDVYKSADPRSAGELVVEINRSLSLPTTENMYGRYLSGASNTGLEIYFVVVPDEDEMLNISKLHDGIVIEDSTNPQTTIKSMHSVL